jgi:hypothetical protein
MNARGCHHVAVVLEVDAGTEPGRRVSAAVMKVEVESPAGGQDRPRAGKWSERAIQDAKRVIAAVSGVDVDDKDSGRRAGHPHVR